MRLYLDDDSIAPILVTLLRRALHDVIVPADLGIAGAADPVHLRHAIREGRVFLSHNYDDFRVLQDLVLEARDIIPVYSSCGGRTIRHEI
jgi:hypothetical protein